MTPWALLRTKTSHTKTYYKPQGLKAKQLAFDTLTHCTPISFHLLLSSTKSVLVVTLLGLLSSMVKSIFFQESGINRSHYLQHKFSFSSAVESSDSRNSTNFLKYVVFHGSSCCLFDLAPRLFTPVQINMADYHSEMTLPL